MVRDRNNRSHKAKGLPQGVAGTYDTETGTDGTDGDLTAPGEQYTGWNGSLSYDDFQPTPFSDIPAGTPVYDERNDHILLKTKEHLADLTTRGYVHPSDDDMYKPIPSMTGTEDMTMLNAACRYDPPHTDRERTERTRQLTNLAEHGNAAILLALSTKKTSIPDDIAGIAATRAAMMASRSLDADMEEGPASAAVGAAIGLLKQYGAPDSDAMDRLLSDRRLAEYGWAASAANSVRLTGRQQCALIDNGQGYELLDRDDLQPEAVEHIAIRCARGEDNGTGYPFSYVYGNAGDKPVPLTDAHIPFECPKYPLQRLREKRFLDDPGLTGRQKRELSEQADIALRNRLEWGGPYIAR